MATEITSIEQLTPDPRNARKHNQRNTGMIVSSLREVGAGRSIVIDENNEILAGRGTWEAANEIGLKQLKVVETDGNTIIAVRRKNLTAEQKQRLALYDNRTAELAEWNEDVLAEMIQDGVSVDGLWTEDELSALLQQSGPEGGAAPEDFKEYDESIETEHCCPKCGYKWSGKQA